MDREGICDTVSGIIYRIKGCHMDNWEANLFGRNCQMSAGDMVILFMELKEIYQIEIETLLKRVGDFSINSLVNEILNQTGPEF